MIEVSKKYFPEYAHIWSHPKLTLFTGDGADYLKKHKKSFDVVIVDSSDPLGPSGFLPCDSMFSRGLKSLNLFSSFSILIREAILQKL